MATRAGLAALVSLVLLAAACAGPTDVPDGAPPVASAPATGEAQEPADDGAPDPDAGPADAAADLPDVPVRPATDQAPAAPPAPERLVISALDIDMTVDRVGIEDDGTMELPPTGERAGWYEFGPAPASPAGTTVVAAHVDTRSGGLGPFAALLEVETGTEVTVTDADGTTHNYTVDGVERIPKDEVQLDAVFDRAGDPRLVLVTCGGTFDQRAGHYADNVVVTAVPAQ